MEAEVYQRMAALESEHWWFVARRRILTDVLARLIQLPPEARLLEAGCGTGGNLAMLSRFGEVKAFEPDAEARRLAQDKSGVEIRPGCLPGDVPYEPGQFDLVAAFDVLEHVEDDLSSLKALQAQLRPGGLALVTVPAFQFLWSRHDERHHHKRRYSKDELVRRASAAGFKPVAVTCFNSLLFPLIAGVRLLKHWLRLEGIEDETMPARLLNSLLCAAFASERHLMGRIPLPLGVSLLMIARKS